MMIPKKIVDPRTIQMPPISFAPAECGVSAIPAVEKAAIREDQPQGDQQEDEPEEVGLGEDALEVATNPGGMSDA